jgi:hypothetical protein
VFASVSGRQERIVVGHLHQLVQSPSPNANIAAIEQRQDERVSKQGAQRLRASGVGKFCVAASTFDSTSPASVRASFAAPTSA